MVFVSKMYRKQLSFGLKSFLLDPNRIIWLGLGSHFECETENFYWGVVRSDLNQILIKFLRKNRVTINKPKAHYFG